MEFKIRTKALKTTAARIESSMRVLDDNASVIDSVIDELSIGDTTYKTLAQKLRRYRDDVTRVTNHCREIGEVADQVVIMYSKTEKKIVFLSKSVKAIDVSDINSLLDAYKIIKTKSARDELKRNTSISDKEYFTLINQERIEARDIHTYSDFRKYLYQNCDRATADAIIITLGITGSLASLDFDGAKIDVKYSGTTSSRNEKAVSAGVLRVSIPGRKGIKSTSVDLEIGTAEAGVLGDASLKTASVSGAAGVALKGFEMKVNQRKGSKYFNKHESMEIKVGDAEAYAEGSINYKGAYGRLGAMADVASVKKTKGLTVFGTDADAWAGAHYGAGAYVEGKATTSSLGVEAYAGAGLGVDGGLSIDYSGAGDYLRHLKTKIAASSYSSGGGGYSSGGGGNGAFGSGLSTAGIR